MVKLLLVLAFVAQIINLTSASSKYDRKQSYKRYQRRTPRVTFACSKNEIWAPCPEAVCAPETCDDVGYLIPCYDLGPDEKCPSKPRCICKEGFVRDNRGVCIPMEYCPSCGGDPNAVSGCGTYCNQLCSDSDQEDEFCTLECNYNACDCKDGYLFDEFTEMCVEPHECTSRQKCHKNEVLDLCPANCPLRTCGINDAAVSCGPALPEGDPDCPPPKCRCKDGYYRHPLGNCVPWEKCPKCKRPNEIYDPCPAPCPPKTCDANPALILCAVPPQLGDPECQPACRCRDGYLRNSTGICIPEDDCYKCTQPHEVYVECPPSCPPQTCESVGKKYHCPLMLENSKQNKKECNGQCMCEKGYYRNKLGECIAEKDCLKCQGPNEYFSCGPACDNVCSKLHEQNQTNCPIVNIVCNPMCYCEEGFARDENNICVPINKCKVSCKGDPNAKPGCGVYCGQRCRDIGKKPGPCILICYPDSCDCKEGYFLDENTGKCVLPKQCTQQCPINEVFSTCIQGNCSPQNCTQIGFPVSCPRIDPAYCKKGCICKEGYARNEKGYCVPINECPCKGDQNKKPGCGVYCNQRCSDIGKKPGACIDICHENSCDCRDGFYLDENTGFCVLPKECTHKCPLNEEYSTCIQSNCSPQKCSQVGFPVPCPRIDPAHCKKGCVCKEGYARNDKGYCVPIKKCPSCKGDPNKIPGCGVYCNQRCSDIGKEPGACIEICYENACDCRDGYYLDENTGFCVLPKQCTHKCPLNEEYSTCIQSTCSPQNCSQIGFPVPCPKIDPAYCKKGCICKEGYARNDKGYCVPINKCPQNCPLNEEYSTCIQSNCSPQNCSQIGFPVHCPRIDPAHCKKGCVCKEGYARNDKGYCVPINKCPSCKGDPNQRPGCGVYCNQRCSDIGKEPRVCIAVCYENACACRDGYYLDENTGFCVLPKQCTHQCPFNEEYSECVQSNCRPQNCSDVGFQTGCAKIDPSYCKKGCICKEGYARNELGYCVPLIECPTCEGDPNKVPGCGVYCNQRCRDLEEKPGACIKICKVNSCDCQDGYYLDENTGFCVLPEECTRQCPANEFYSECTQGNCSPEYCTQLGSPIACPRIDPKYCKKGCLCKDGYARNDKGVCIPTEECSPTCPANEVYSDCINGGCQARNCSQYGKPVPCVKIDPKYCIKGCVCQEGYLRSSCGLCVPENDCPEACNQPNEEYNKCSWDCPPQTCESLDRAYACPIKSDQNCKPKCRCKSGYFRNKLGQCITEEQCRRCMGPHEYFSCGGACDNVCSTLHKQNQTNCPIVNIKCNEMCYCEKGYARAYNKTCIPIKYCKYEPICGKHEVYEDCSNPLCKAEYCQDLGIPLDCNRKCRKGCICEDGYVRDKNGRCILVNQCPSCGGDPNAQSGCGVNCGKHCSDIGGKGPVMCTAICQLNGCDCKDGYYYNNIIKRCVKPEQCFGQCPVNERYEECPGATCEPQNCYQLGFPIPCLEEVINSCPKKPACVCMDGYVRDGNGRCIPKNHCPSCGGDPFARSGCGVNCGKRCRDLGKGITPCLRICYPNSCDCIDGYFYDSYQKKCVLPKQCTDICDKNEIFEDCSNPTCKAQTCAELGFPLNCNATCVKRCTCPYGYVRNEKGNCIPSNQCPSCGGDPNAHLGCGTNCGRRCPNNYINPKFCPKIQCVPELNRCDCNDGFYYDINTKTCVKPEECSPRCDPKNNEEFDSCANGGCGWRNCSQVGGPILCIDPIKCEKGCKCREGYYRLDNGTCVPKNKCPINKFTHYKD